MTRRRRGDGALCGLCAAVVAVAAGQSLLGALTTTPPEQPDAPLPRLLTAPVGSPQGVGPPAGSGVDPQRRARSLALRAARRAYEGAPPVVPHPTAGLSPAACRECHATGLTAGPLVARKASHPYLFNCFQCHVEQANAVFGQGEAPAENRFTGARPRGQGGSRAYPGAPPTIPHTLLMRTSCNSCHGALGYEGLRTTHPERLNCVQCHAPDVRYDARLGGAVAP